MLSDEQLEFARKANRINAKNELLDLLRVCPQVIPPAIGIEAYLGLLDEGIELMLKRGVKAYPVD